MASEATSEANKKLIILRGLPGSGKSTLAWSILREISHKPERLIARVFSTDDYWLRPDGIYDFNAAKLREAHSWCFGKVTQFMRHCSLFKDPAVAILDNTNIKRRDFAHYVEYARSLDWKVEERTPATPWAWDAEACAESTLHRVPLEVIRRMQAEWED